MGKWILEGALKASFFCEIRRLEPGNNILRHNCGVILILVYVIEDSDV